MLNNFFSSSLWAMQKQDKDGDDDTFIFSLNQEIKMSVEQDANLHL